MHDLIFAIDIEKREVSRLLIIHTVNYHYGGIIKILQPLIYAQVVLFSSVEYYILTVHF